MVDMKPIAAYSIALIILSLTISLTACSTKSAPSTNQQTANSSIRRITVGLLPKRKGISYFTSCYEGAEAAAKELGNVELIYDGPTESDPTKAAELVGQWALQGFDVIAVSADDGQILGAAMQKAQSQGVKCISWDADTPAESRSFFVNQATPQQIGFALVDLLVKDIGEAGEVAIISSSQTSANQNAWIAQMKTRLERYPNLRLIAIEYPGEDQDRCLSTTRTLLRAHPDLKGIWGISSVAFPGAAEAVRQAGLSGKVFVTGLSTPNPMKTYVKDGTVKTFVLWDTRDLGYLTVYTAEALARGKLKPGETSFTAGRLGKRTIEGNNILLGDMLVFNNDNIDEYDF
jgi:ABC-type sugar transport system substrate-binding protein